MKLRNLEERQKIKMVKISKDMITCIFNYLPFEDCARLRTTSQMFDRAFRTFPLVDHRAITQKMDELRIQKATLINMLKKQAMLMDQVSSMREDSRTFVKWFVNKFVQATNERIARCEFDVNGKCPMLLNANQIFEDTKGIRILHQSDKGVFEIHTIYNSTPGRFHIAIAYNKYGRKRWRGWDSLTLWDFIENDEMGMPRYRNQSKVNTFTTQHILELAIYYGFESVGFQMMRSLGYEPNFNPVDQNSVTKTLFKSIQRRQPMNIQNFVNNGVFVNGNDESDSETDEISSVDGESLGESSDDDDEGEHVEINLLDFLRAGHLLQHMQQHINAGRGNNNNDNNNAN